MPWTVRICNVLCEKENPAHSQDSQDFQPGAKFSTMFDLDQDVKLSKTTSSTVVAVEARANLKVD